MDGEDVGSGGHASRMWMIYVTRHAAVRVVRGGGIRPVVVVAVAVVRTETPRDVQSRIGKGHPAGAESSGGSIAAPGTLRTQE